MKERRFETWRIGLLHLAIVVVMPVIPVIIYMITEGTGKAYLYALILTVVVSFLYEYMGPSYQDCGRLLRVECIVCSAFLILMLIGGLFLLFLLFAQEDGILVNVDIAFWSGVLVAMFSVPLITTVIEIIRCVAHDLETGGYLPDEENNMRGAAQL